MATPLIPGDLIRVLSDIHFGDRSSRVDSLESLRPLADGASALVLNGDSLDTRPGPRPAFTDRCRQEVAAFFTGLGLPVTFITGNHDPDITERHWADLADGRVWVLHGDVLFEEMVPWGGDARTIRAAVRAALAEQTKAPDALSLEDRMALYRQVARAIPQRHQSEPRAAHHFGRLIADLCWPPWRVPNLLAAWRTAPHRAHAFSRRYRPKSRFTLIGHTHRPGVWRGPDGTVVINTGSFTRPFGSWTADIAADGLRVRRVVRQSGEFRLGDPVAEFAF